MTCLATACASPDPINYTLNVVNGAPLPGPAVTVEVRRPGLAGYLDRSDVVLKASGNTLTVNSQSRWAEPLGDMIGRVLAQDLSQRLPGSSVFAQAGGLSAEPAMRVEVDILNFDADGSGSVMLQAEVVVERGVTHRPLATRHVALSVVQDGVGAGALAAGMSGLLGKLADQVAGDVRGTGLGS